MRLDHDSQALRTVTDPREFGKVAVLFGGTTTTLPQPFTFTLTNTAWSKEFSLLNPMARADHTLQA